MSSGLFEAFLYRSAREFLEQATPEERQEVGRIIDQLLCFDPWIDNRTKLHFPLYPVIITLYSDGQHWIIYHVQNNHEIRIWNIGRAHDEKPMPYRG